MVLIPSPAHPHPIIIFAQALINPYLYGIRWRDSLLVVGGGAPTALNKTAAIDSSVDSPPESASSPAVPMVPATPPSLPASPPGSTRPSSAATEGRKEAWAEEGSAGHAC